MKELQKEVKGTYVPEAYFAHSHRIVPSKEYKTFANRQKLHFSRCYNVMTFKTEDSDWELFFHLVKDGVTFSEIINIRVFPKHNKIRSEGNIEKAHGGLNFFTNNRYLNEKLEEEVIKERLEKILTKTGDIMLISHGGMHYKAFIDGKNLNVHKVMEIIKAMHYIKTKVFKEGVLEY